MLHTGIQIITLPLSGLLRNICVVTSLSIPFSFSHAFQSSSEPAAEVPIEKIYLHVDKSYYSAGEDIWFKAYLVDGKTFQPAPFSEIVYVELIAPDNTIVSKKTLKTTNGSAPGDFKLSRQAQNGAYTIRAYTAYMRNFEDDLFYTKNILVSPARPVAASAASQRPSDANGNGPDLQFFPEGGDMLSGFVNPVAFKAIDTNGKGITVSGTLIDASGKTVKKFKSTHLGMGVLHFIPEKGNSYTALLSHNAKEFRYPLPRALDTGVLMRVSDYTGFYKIELRATTAFAINEHTLVGTQHGLPVFQSAVNTTKNNTSAVIKLPKNLLKEGITVLTLLNASKEPVAERLIFHQHENRFPKAKVTTQQQTYAPNTLVSLEIALDSTNRTLEAADISVAVAHTAVVPNSGDAIDIKTYLLLNSELKGTIERPGYYFYSNDPKRKKNLDLLMRTQGWRHYAIKELKQFFAPETGVSISGKVVRSLSPNSPLTGTVFLTSTTKDEIVQDRVKTDVNGAFRFTALDLTDTTAVLLNARVADTLNKKKRKGTLNYTFILDSVASPQVKFKKTARVQTEDFTGNIKEAQNLSNSFFAISDKTVQLKEVMIIEKKETTTIREETIKRKRKSSLYLQASQTVDLNDIAVIPSVNPLLILKGRVPGVAVRNDGVYIRGNNSLTGGNKALLLLDGIPISNEGTINEQLTIPPDEIDFIDIIKGPRAAIYGSRASNGIIAIYTKDGREKLREAKKLDGAFNFELAGYDYARTFYQPKYEDTKRSSQVTQNFTTLHWQPTIALDPNGKANIAFYSGEVPGAYTITLEGITATGVPLKASSSFRVD